MSQKTRTIRISMDVYKKLCEIGRKNDSFSEIIDRIFTENNLIAAVTENERAEPQ